MKKLFKKLMSCICMTAILTAGSLVNAAAATTTDTALNDYRIHGPVTKSEHGQLIIDNQESTGYTGEIILNISSETTKILDAVTGSPVTVDDIRDGETIYAYIRPVMTMSIPPMTNASLILCNIPADFRVPAYQQSDVLTVNEDGVSGSVKTTDGTTYTIPADCEIFPYLTRNIVRIQDLTEGRTFLVWADDQNRASRIMVFPKEADTRTGWSLEGDSWFYYDENGSMVKGWLLDNGSWYYLDPETGVMKTGFLFYEGRTYYLQEDGRMLTSAKTFTPDSTGALH